MLLVLLAAAASLRADVSLAPLFQDGAVLQRDKPVPVWGWAAPGERVSVTLGEDRVSTTADAAGRWLVRLEPRPARATPQELVAAAGNRVVIRDVVVGDVWLCSGQSNMKMSAKAAQDADAEAAGARFPLIRQFKVDSRFEDTPRASVGGAWVACSPRTFESFTAVGIFFARRIWHELGVPVGIVSSAYGNTPIASWRQAAAVAGEPGVVRWWAEERRKTPPPRPHRAPSACYNGMIHPLAPYALRGMLWYQGESDASEATTLAPLYARQFTGLIQEWREAFQQPDLPFFWVQLAGFDEKGLRAWPEVRDAQAAALRLGNTGQAVAIDVGEAANIHARNKQAVGERLARLALRRVHGRELEDTGPTPQGVTREGERLRIRFAHAAGGIRASGDVAAACEVFDAQNRRVPATSAQVEGQTLVVQAAGVRAPRGVRFGWQAIPPGALHNADGLPAAPFSISVEEP